jgi:hypothetical protein
MERKGELILVAENEIHATASSGMSYPVNAKPLCTASEYSSLFNILGL